jgi:hypothetical protein
MAHHQGEPIELARFPSIFRAQKSLVPTAIGVSLSDSGVCPGLVAAELLCQTRLREVFADFLTDGMEPTPADASAWSLYDLGGSLLRFTFTFFYVDSIASPPEASWPR